MNKQALIRLLLIVLLVAGIILGLEYRAALSADALQGWLTQWGVAAPLLFMLIYAAATVLFLPGSLLTLAGGALFGPLWGTLYNLTGATLGATLAFLVARYLGADWVEKKSGERLGRIKAGVEAEGWRFVAFTRLVPLFPFNLLNYALGLTRIRLGHYIVASYLCMLPGAIAYTYLGYAGREAVAGGEGMIQKGLLALALLALVAFLPRLIQQLRSINWLSVEQLREALKTDTPLLLDVREVDEFSGEQGHIDGALNIPLDSLAGQLESLREAQGSGQEIVLICRTDKRSAKAAKLLKQAGVERVRVLRQGMTAWNRAKPPA